MNGGRYMFSCDVEDPRDGFAGGERFPARVPVLVEAYLDFLRRCGGRGTFFFVGDVARRHPTLVRSVVAEGHEIGCHSDRHVPLQQQDRAGFRDDLLRNIEALDAAGAGPIVGYRAPCLSMTETTRWAYGVLAGLGFVYSSSVLPGRNPRYGWAGFGEGPTMIDGVLELPVTLTSHGCLSTPFGGVYFRILPRAILRRAMARQAAAGAPLLSYHHPYDLDVDQPYPHPDFLSWSPFGILMRTGRATVLPRLEMARQLGFSFEAYADYAAEGLTDRPRETDLV